MYSNWMKPIKLKNDFSKSLSRNHNKRHERKWSNYLEIYNVSNVNKNSTNSVLTSVSVNQ